MPRTDIRDILKDGENTVVKTVNYNDPAKLQQLKALRLETLNRLNQSRRPIANFIIDKGIYDRI